MHKSISVYNVYNVIKNYWKLDAKEIMFKFNLYAIDLAQFMQKVII